MSDPTVLVDVADRIATITLNRPDARNAINPQLAAELWDAVADADADPAVAVMVLTGAGSAFCAGLDLRELASGRDPSATTSTRHPRPRSVPHRFFPVVDTPVIGAVNGAAITGGFELALHCTFLIASEHARFADTHARVGILPGAGLTPLLAEAVGVQRALELSLTGNFLGAVDALNYGLVNRVVAHDELLTVARSVAADIADNDARAVRALVGHYRDLADDPTITARYEREAKLHRGFGGLSTNTERVDGVIERGRAQQSPS